MTNNLEEYNDLLDKIHKHRLQFLGLIDMSREDAISKISSLKFNTYAALKSSVNYHAKKPFININTATTIVSHPAIPIVETYQNTDAQKVNQMATYKKILDVDTDVATIDEKYLPIREEYLQELASMESNGGCSSCQRGKLRRKFIDKLTALDKANNES